MPPKKYQHFVPKAYLKAFASEPRRTNLYVIERDKFVSNASIRDQCRIRWFYGRDEGLEDVVQKVESGAVPVVRKICRTHNLPERGSPQHHLLCFLVGLQVLRTRKSLEQANALISKYGDVLEQEDLRLPNEDAVVRPRQLDGPAPLMLDLVVPYVQALETLGCHLLTLSGEAGAKFITSDHPATRHNGYLRGVTDRGTIGINNVGVSVFFPLAPDVLLLLYDDSVYRVGTRRSNVSRLIRNREVRAINSLQATWADECVYFADWTMRQEVRKTVRAVYGVRARFEGARVSVFEDPESPGAGVIANQHIGPDLDLNLSIMKVRRKKRRVPIGERADEYRDGSPADVEALEAVQRWERKYSL